MRAPLRSNTYGKGRLPRPFLYGAAIVRPKARVMRWGDCADPDAARAEIEAIFFEASNTKSFATEAARAQFCERWLGRYLTCDADKVYVAPDSDGAVIGYLAGSFDDPARTPRFSDIPYFAELADLTQHYPAHLHVNLSPVARGQSIGSDLVRAFAAAAAAAGLPGVHVVTSANARNVSFYKRLGFLERRRFPFKGHDLVFLGRDL